MSAATAPAVNGTTAPSSSSSTPTPASGAPAAAAAGGKPEVQPSEVGWLFVPQYYTFLNQNPGSLHRFYTKKSTLVHGTELEDTAPCFGQQEIHSKIVSLGFDDCKVFVSNVDSQSSASGGIIIQVLGEMSNAAGPWRKFAQTFFLAEQPNGYFVLNDIFRFLKEEDDEEVEEGATAPHEQNAPATVEAPTEPAAPAPVVAPEPAAPEPTPEPVTAVAEVQAESESEPAAAEPAATPAVVNGTQDEAAADPAKPNEAGLDKKVAVVEVDSAPAPPAVAAAKEEAPAEPVPAAKAAPAPASVPEPAAPVAPKTWANLAASNAKSWGSNISAEARGISAARPTPAKQQGGGASPATANASGSGANGTPRAPAPAHAGQPQTPMQQALAHDSKSVFIKNVLVEHMPEEGLKAALEAQFGPMSECQLVPAKACAFGTFDTVDAARRAIVMSLRVQDGGKGGVPVGNKGWTVTVAQKKGLNERPERGPFRGARGGARGGAAGRGRGGAAASSTNA